MISTGAHSVTIYPLSLDPSATPPLQGLVYAEDQWTIAPIEVFYQERQQHTAQLEG